MSNINFQKTFNNKSYDVTFIIRNDDITLTSPDLISSGDKSSLILTENVTYFMMDNAISRFVPSAEFEVFDGGFNITNFLKNLNTRISVSISTIANEVTTSFDLTFIVKNYEIITINKESICYKIYADLDNCIPLYTLCSYATTSSLEYDNENMENPYEIARSILTQVGYKLYPIEEIADDGSKIATKYSLPYTNEVCHFITYPNMKAIDAIKYLLSYGIGESGTNSPAYLIHNLIDNKGYITSLGNLWNSVSIQDQPSSTKFPFSATKITLNSKQFIMTDLTTNSQIGRNRSS